MDALTIRNFGDDRACNDPDELFKALSTHYRGRSISVKVTGARTGLVSSIFICVGDDGAVQASYGERCGEEGLRALLLQAMETI